MTTFETLGLQESLLSAIKKLGFYEATPVQEATIPLIKAGRDVIAMSNTGSGKTFAFAAGIIEHAKPKRGVQAIILVPTRELAEQMHLAFKTFTKGTALKAAAIYGGVSLKPQFSAIAKAEIIIGTPGRILDHLERKTLQLKGVRQAILDEADRMLDMGFLPDVKKILKTCPKERQTLLFSATMPAEIKKLAREFMHEPEHVDLAEQVDPAKLTQETYLVNAKHKQAVLAHLLREEQDKELSIVFCNTRDQTETTAKALKKDGIKAATIHGGLSQNQRLRVIKAFNAKNSLGVLVCTDVAARGLDIPGVTHVYNYDLPREPKQYLHRIGRTARAGAQGKAINIVGQRDMGRYRQAMRANNLSIKPKDAPLPEQRLQASDKEREAPQRGQRKRYSKDKGGKPQGSRPAFVKKRTQGKKPTRRR